MVLARLLIATIVAALVAAFAPSYQEQKDAAYWGTDAYAATKPRSSVHCLVFRFALIDGKQLVLLDQKPLGEVPCPASRSRRA